MPWERPQETDAGWMGRALALAEASVGLASPNPRVGCVLVKNGDIVGRGAHHYERKDHAEVVALREAGPNARGATAYVTLEPCSHTGRTPPCADALVKAGVARVIIATEDPNPLVNGRGVARLRAAGIEVLLAVLQDEARALNNGFARFVRDGAPFVTLKAGVSLDGRIAPSSASKAPGSTVYLTAERSLRAVQEMRHASDAVLTGIGTVLEDDPLLTDRSGGARRRPLLRVVLDSELRLPLTSRLVQTTQNDLLIATGERPDDSAHAQRRRTLEAAGVRVCSAPSAANGPLDLSPVLRLLAAEHRVLNVLAEGGSRLNRALLSGTDGTPIADKLCLFYAPVLLGEQGVPLVTGGGRVELTQRKLTLAESGSDFRMEAYLRDPWPEG